jgi:hypothetical protein
MASMGDELPDFSGGLQYPETSSRIKGCLLYIARIYSNINSKKAVCLLLVSQDTLLNRKTIKLLLIIEQKLKLPVYRRVARSGIIKEIGKNTLIFIESRDTFYSADPNITIAILGNVFYNIISNG